jgi:hypothetical protein
MKKCSKCKESKEFQYFFRDKQKADRLTSCCKSCILLEDRINRQDPDFLEKKREMSRKSNRNKRLDPEFRAKENEYRLNRYKNDPEYRHKTIQQSCKFLKKVRNTNPKQRMIINCRRRFNLFLNGKNKKSFSQNIGCTLEELILHIQSKFQIGMSWDNYGKWHIDHVYPLSVAYDKGEDMFKKACNYKNLQPLWALDNIRKGNKVVSEL